MARQIFRTPNTPNTFFLLTRAFLLTPARANTCHACSYLESVLRVSRDTLCKRLRNVLLFDFRVERNVSTVCDFLCALVHHF